ncbi:hypothetical protein [Alicyclobacillus dauci]|uniref:Uncharacterized protein n=1 Tax=Alicyclobacillus dauci TaxID=1475485 RepID=A0ABY6Z4H1_9BACL|nr:hypothetical protein [Alicyclobacillus dauci]WAH37091.1 hypothetical protein NZD86_00480 [Alicyclobacillus dauci]
MNWFQFVKAIHSNLLGIFYQPVVQPIHKGVMTVAQIIDLSELRRLELAALLAELTEKLTFIMGLTQRDLRKLSRQEKDLLTEQLTIIEREAVELADLLGIYTEEIAASI